MRTSLLTCSVASAVTLALSGAALAQDQPPSELLSRLTRAHAEMLASAEDAASSAGQVAEILKRATVGASDTGEFSDTFFTELISRYPGLFLLDTNVLETPSGVQTDANAIRIGLEKSLEQFRRKNPVECFGGDPITFRASAACKTLLAELCSSYTASGAQLSATTIGPTFAAERVTISSIADLDRLREMQYSRDGDAQMPQRLADASRVWQQRQYSFCRLAAASGAMFKAKTPAVYPTIGKYPEKLYYAPGTREDFENECTAIDVNSLERNLYDLEIDFPEFFMLKYWKEAIESRSKYCQEAVTSECANTYVIADEVILAYVTKACEIREVTAADVDDDIAQFAALGVTHADRLKHAQLKETIRLCKAAHTAGFPWRYVPPKLTGCNKSGPSNPKPGAKKP